MALFSNKSVDREAQRIDQMLRERYEDVFTFNGEDFWLGRNESTIVGIKLMTFSEEERSVHINAWVVMDVPVTPTLTYELLANPEYKFIIGRWEIELDEDGSGNGMLLLGTDLIDFDGSLDLPELAASIELIAQQADSIDEVLAARFNGKTAVDALE